MQLSLGFDLPQQQWSLLNRFRAEQGHCGAYKRKWRLTNTDLCPCGETQTMSHIVESCPLTKLNGGLSRLHSADEDAVSWVTSYGSWHAYEKKSQWRLVHMCVDGQLYCIVPIEYSFPWYVLRQNAWRKLWMICHVISSTYYEGSIWITSNWCSLIAVY